MEVGRIMKIVNCDEEIIGHVAKISKILYAIYGEQDVIVFPTLEEGNKLGFISRLGELCAFINYKGEYTLFSLDENDDVLAVSKDGMTVVFGEVVKIIKDDKEYAIGIDKLDEVDMEGYDGCVTFTQYDKDQDVMCRLDYQQMYRDYDGRVPIYSYHTKKVNRAYIKENYSKPGTDRIGFLPRSDKFFDKMTFCAGELGYKITAFKEYGLYEFLTKGAYNLLRTNEVVRFAKVAAISGNGNYIELWPLDKGYTEDEILDLIKQYGFETEVPEELLTIYNGGNRDIQLVKELAKLMKELKPELDKEEHHDKCMILELRK